MNEGLNVISLEAAKNMLAVDFGDDDEQITLLIDTAVAMVERYTDHALWQRDREWHATCNETTIATYPIADVSATLGGVATSVIVLNRTLSTVVKCAPGATIKATIGYSDRGCIPSPLISACYKIITYLYQNKDNYTATLPTDVQMLLNQWRRSATI